jgi:hypothetical protein
MKAKKRCPHCNIHSYARTPIYDNANQMVLIKCTFCGFEMARRIDVMGASANKAGTVLKIMSSIVIDDWNTCQLAKNTTKTELEEFLEQIP